VPPRSTGGRCCARPYPPGSGPARVSSALPCPAGRSAPGRGGPERRRRPRPDGTGTHRSVLGPWRTGTTRARVVSNGHHGQRGTAGRLASSSGSSPDANQRIRLWSRRPGGNACRLPAAAPPPAAWPRGPWPPNANVTPLVRGCPTRPRGHAGPRGIRVGQTTTGTSGHPTAGPLGRSLVARSLKLADTEAVTNRQIELLSVRYIRLLAARSGSTPGSQVAAGSEDCPGSPVVWLSRGCGSGSAAASSPSPKARASMVPTPHGQ
jgi:hypothetical protein